MVIENNQNLHHKVTEFRNPMKVGLYVTLALTGSVLTIIMLAITFFLMLLSNKSSPFMPGLMGGMSILPIMGISIAIYMLRMPVKILIHEQGLTIEWLIKRKLFYWNEIAKIELKDVDFARTWWGSFTGKKGVPKECLVLLNCNDGKIATIGGDIENFHTLVQEVHNRTSVSQGVSTFNARTQISRQAKKLKANRITIFVLGLFFAIGGTAFGIMSIVEEHNKRMLDNEGQLIEATINRHYMYNITPRIEYTFTAPDGLVYSQNVMVEREFWDSLEENGTVTVKYLPNNPKNNKLLTGQAESMDPPFVLCITASIGVTTLGIICLGMFAFRISDIKFENGRFKIVRTDYVELSDTAKTLIDNNEHTETTEEPQSLILETETVNVYANIPHKSNNIIQTNKLPGGLKAIGILNIFFGSLGLLWNILRIILACVFIIRPVTVFENMQIQPTNLVYTFLSHGLFVLAAFLLVLSGVGILFLKNWGRILGIAAACGKIVLSTIELILTFFMNAELFSNEQQFSFNVGRAFIVFVILLTIIYPLVVFVILLHKSTRQAFKNKKLPCLINPE
ncbi:MAG: hypothetical protein ACYTE8_05900 [Planctomycetota bacterium]|jgi:hypothetical protein